VLERLRDAWSKRDWSTVDWPMAITQFVLVAFGIAGLFFHVTEPLLTHDGDWPNFDQLELLWLLPIAFAVLLPRIVEVGLPGGTSVRLRRVSNEAQEALAKAQRALDQTSLLLANWASAVNLLCGWLGDTALPDGTKIRRALRFCEDRMEEAAEELSVDDEPIRISVWLWDDEQDGLVLVLSNEIRDEATRTYVFREGVGLLSQAFVEDRIFVFPDAQASPHYVDIPGAKPRYHGLMLIPIRHNEHPIGVLSVDRELATVFDDKAENTASALADLICVALTHPAIADGLRNWPAL
jgi:GAF domain-containing protein